VLKKLLPKLQGKIAVSQAAKECVSRYLPGDYQIIPNGVDIDFFSAQVPPLEEFADGKVNILFVGRLERRKGLDCLLVAYGRAKKEFPSLRLIVVGTGAKLPRYESMVGENDLADVVFAGFVPKTNLARYYSSADICCFPATSAESFGIVLLEAMASGKPVVASNVAGYSELLSHREEGVVIPAKDEEALTRALLLLAQDRHLRQQMGAKGRDKAEKYSWENVARGVMRYYVALLNGPYNVK
jgi:phosphatidylinositol alpha-mannosyltransferase